MSQAYHRHPEFEYFRPLLNFCRKAAVAIAVIALGLIGGALALTEGDHLFADMSSMIASNDEIPSSAQTSSVAGSTPAERPLPSEASKRTCEHDTWAYLDGKCGPGRARKARRSRAATDRPLARSVPPMPAASRLAPKLASGADAASAAAAVKSTGQSKPALKKTRKTANSQTIGQDVSKTKSSSREKRVRDERWSARAYALPDQRNPPGQYERSWGWSR